jgi:uncharacterized membrane protein
MMAGTMPQIFDLRTIVLAKHAQHVVLVHFPIALFVTGIGFDFLSVTKRFARLADAAYLNLSIAAFAVLPTFVTGLLAWQFALEGKRLKGLLLWHLIAGSGSALLVVASWWLHRQARRTHPALFPAYRFPLEMLGLVLVVFTAHLGGYLSGINS